MSKRKKVKPLLKGQAQVKDYTRTGPGGQLVHVGQYSQDRKDGQANFDDKRPTSTKTNASKPSQSAGRPEESGGASKAPEIATPKQFEKFKKHLPAFKGRNLHMSITSNKRTGNDYAILQSKDRKSGVMVGDDGKIVAYKSMASSWKAVPTVLKEVYNDLYHKIPAGSGDKVGCLKSESGTELAYYHNKAKDEFAYYNIKDGLAGIRKSDGTFVSKRDMKETRNREKKLFSEMDKISQDLIDMRNETNTDYTFARWFREEDQSAKKQITELFERKPEMVQKGQEMFYKQYLLDNEDISFEEFLDTDVTLYRGGEEHGEMFSAYSMDKDIAQSFADQKGSTVTEITVKPRDTYGMHRDAGEREIFVKQDISPGAYTDWANDRVAQWSSDKFKQHESTLRPLYEEEGQAYYEAVKKIDEDKN